MKTKINENGSREIVENKIDKIDHLIRNNMTKIKYHCKQCNKLWEEIEENLKKLDLLNDNEEKEDEKSK